ncbi:mucin-2, partial [Biomphalaria glabrata]
MSIARNLFLLKTFATVLGLSLSYFQNIEPANFFYQINIIPHGHFKNFLCGVFRQNPGPYGDSREAQIVHKTDFQALDYLLQSWIQRTRNNPFFFSEFDPNNRIKKHDQKLANPLAGNRLLNSVSDIHSSPQTSFQHQSQYKDYIRIFLSLKFYLQSGLNPNQFQQMRSTLLLSVAMQDLDFLFDLIYVEKGISSEDVLDVVQYFFAIDPYSNSRSLADVDRRRAFIEIILAANGRVPCPKCPVYFQDFKDVARAVFWNLLPPGPFEDMRVAVTAMIALSEAKFYPQGLINMFDSFLQ